MPQSVVNTALPRIPSPERAPGWHKAYGGMSINEAQRLKELEKENGRLKRLLAERMLENDLLKELLEKKG